jgi:hypothetical protein
MKQKTRPAGAEPGTGTQTVVWAAWLNSSNYERIPSRLRPRGKRFYE